MLRLQLFITYLMAASPTPVPKKHPYVNSATSGEVSSDKGKIVGGWVGDAGEEIYQAIVNGIVDGFTWLVKTIFDFISPLMNWGSQIIIAACVVIYFCSHEKKYISSAMKWGIIFVIFNVIMGAVK